MNAAAMAVRNARMRTGQAMGPACQPTYATPGECPPPGCWPPGANLADMLGRQLAGSTGRCREVALPLSDAAVGIGATVTLTATAQGTICPNRLNIFSPTAQDGFEITAFTIGNVPQFLTGQNLHSRQFAPDAVQAVPFKGDCLGPGITVSITVVNLDAAAQGIWVALIGPATY